ncbi:MAG: methyl-accepting chemotaxis protein, partial [Coleofasciculaceae cyanobacterium]
MSKSSFDFQNEQVDYNQKKLLENTSESNLNFENLGQVSNEQAISASLTSLPSSNNSSFARKNKTSFLNKFYDLPIQRKQLIGLFTSEVISILGLVGVGAWLIITGGRTQLLNQAKSELVITELNYNIKIDQMGFGFRGQSDNLEIITAAQTQAEGKALDSGLKTRVEQILQNEIKARNIEYATLVGKDLRIIVNANADRTGETFDPNNLVSQVFTEQEQIKSSEIVSWSELSKESPPLPEGFTNQDALIRYTVTPVKNTQTKQVIGVLVSGDIVNDKLPIVEKTTSSFGGGYSAIYQREDDGEYALATALEQSQSNEQSTDVILPNNSLLEAAVASPEETVTQRVTLAGQTYTMAAKALNNSAGVPVAILLRGTPETALNLLLNNSLLLQIIVSAFALVADILLAIILGRAIVKPVKELQSTAQEFSTGNRQARAEIFAADECGQLASTFNEMADSIEISIEEIRHKEELLRQETEQVKAAKQVAEHLAQEQREQKEELQKRCLALLKELEPMATGDLTLRARVTADEIGTIADAYNATVSRLQKAVLQMQGAAEQVTDNTGKSQSYVETLLEEALTAQEAITAALDRTKIMADSVQDVAESARQVEAAVQQATQTVEEGDSAMNRTVEGIVAIRETVEQTAKKVKRLGESSQKISVVVNLISNIAAQTNLLAFNASLEAARAGEEGRGFAVVADQVRTLAQESAAATGEIEQLVASIQTETEEVVTAMEAGTEQVVTGTKLVDETRHSLNNIATASAEINKLVEAIIKATVVQSSASDSVGKTITEVAEITRKTSMASDQFLFSFDQLK